MEQRGRQLETTWVPPTASIALQSAVVPVAGVGVIKSLTHSWRLWIGVNIPECIQPPLWSFGAMAVA
jgi:hypothetical protein